MRPATQLVADRGIAEPDDQVALAAGEVPDEGLPGALAVLVALEPRPQEPVGAACKLAGAGQMRVQVAGRTAGRRAAKPSWCCRQRAQRGSRPPLAGSAGAPTSCMQWTGFGHA